MSIYLINLKIRPLQGVMVMNKSIIPTLVVTISILFFTPIYAGTYLYTDQLSGNPSPVFDNKISVLQIEGMEYYKVVTWGGKVYEWYHFDADYSLLEKHIFQYENGQLKMITVYDNNNQKEYDTYYKNGEVWQVVYYRPDGTVEKWEGYMDAEESWTGEKTYFKIFYSEEGKENKAEYFIEEQQVGYAEYVYTDNQKEKIIYNMEDIKQEYELYQNDVLRLKERYEDGLILFKHEFNEEGVMEKSTRYRDGNLFRVQYYEEGKVVKEEKYNRSGTLEEAIFYGNTASPIEPDRAIKEKYEYYVGGTLRTIIYFDQLERKIKQEVFNQDGEIEYYFTYNYQDNSRNLIKETKFNPEGVIIEEIEY